MYDQYLSTIGVSASILPLKHDINKYQHVHDEKQRIVLSWLVVSFRRIGVGRQWRKTNGLQPISINRTNDMTHMTHIYIYIHNITIYIHIINMYIHNITNILYIYNGLWFQFLRFIFHAVIMIWPSRLKMGLAHLATDWVPAWMRNE
jgi:hypothetical protein